MAKHSRSRHLFLPIFSGICLTIACCALFAACWYIRIFGDVGFDALLFTLLSDLGSTESGTVTNYFIHCLLPALLTDAGLLLALFLVPRFFHLKPKAHARQVLVSSLLALVACVVLFNRAFTISGLHRFIYSKLHTSTLYEERYVDPDTVPITFPEEKRNLIYIYLESMENTYLSEAEGGAEPVNMIPELYDLSCEHLNFSQSDGVGGAHVLSGATWTVGAMVAHTAGIPLCLPLDKDAYGDFSRPFLPGVTSINDLLHQNGYRQALLLGSDGTFGGRAQYFTQHGVDQVYDLYTAYEDGIVPDGYWVWWGMEDKYLFEYAQTVLTDLAQDDTPFAFTMLTADTHHIGGYVCSECGSEHEEQYENVLSCSSRQVAQFVRWILEQDFAKDTVIIVTGDHTTMDAGYITRNIVPGYDRRVYNCFINAVPSTEFAKNRDFSTLDMFPTTLAALGCTIEGEQLGLGVNLFSGEPTLVEQMGAKTLSDLLAQNSRFYADRFL